MPVTLKDIAQLAGVSVGTVDRALHNRGRINPEVSERICRIADELGYRTNIVAKSLATRKKLLKIGFILHVHHNDFFGAVISGAHKAEQELQDFGISIEIYRSNNFNPESQLSQIQQALADGVCAIAIVPLDDPKIKALLKSLHEKQFPIVFVTSYLSDVPVLASVHCDYYLSGRIAAKMLQLFMKDSGNSLAFFPSFSMIGHRLRAEGVKHYIQECCPSVNLVDTIEISNDDFDIYGTVQQALETYPDTKGIIFCGETAGALKVINRLKPEITKIFFDLSPAVKENLRNDFVQAAICQDPKAQGYQAIRILFDYITASKLPNNHDIIIPTTITLKEHLTAYSLSETESTKATSSMTCQ